MTDHNNLAPKGGKRRKTIDLRSTAGSKSVSTNTFRATSTLISAVIWSLFGIAVVAMVAWALNAYRG